jgi:isoleucyl-tRNA synthetase
VTDPLQKARIEQMRQLILDEVNVKELTFVEDGDGMLVKKVKCNFRVMGKKFGKQMKSVSQAVAEMSQADIATLEKNGQLTLSVEGGDATIELSDVEILSEDIPGWTVANEGNLTVALDITITPELRNEALAREVVKRIQGIRKDSGFDITDRIDVVVSDTKELNDAINAFSDYISGQVLANSLTICDASEGTDIDIDGIQARISVKKC